MILNSYELQQIKTDLLAKACIELYFRVSEIFKPTPQTPYMKYTFRDINNVLDGIKLIPTSSLKDQPVLFKVWSH